MTWPGGMTAQAPGFDTVRPRASSRAAAHPTSLRMNAKRLGSRLGSQARRRCRSIRLLLLAFGSVALSAAEAREAPAIAPSLQDYAFGPYTVRQVVPENETNTKIPPFSDATASDQTPRIEAQTQREALPRDIAEQVAAVKQEERKVETAFEASRAKTDAIDQEETALGQYEQSALATVGASVRALNKEETEAIVEAPATQGVPGPPGVSGLDGEEGIVGREGRPGASLPASSMILPTCACSF